MTQVTGLGFGKLMSAEQTATVEDAVGLAEQFAALMNQNTRQTFDLTAGTDHFVRQSSGNGVDASQQSYEKLSGNVKKIAQADLKTNAQKFSEKAEHLAGEVEEVIKNTFELTDEELSAAMETLGLSAMDLLQSQNLVQLMQELTGATDALSLLMDDNVQGLMQEVNGLLQSFMQETGLNSEQFADLLQELSAENGSLEQQFVENLAATEILTQNVVDSDEKSGQEHVRETETIVRKGQTEQPQVQEEQLAETEEEHVQGLEQTGDTARQSAEDGTDADSLMQGSTDSAFEETSFEDLLDGRTAETQTAAFGQEFSAAAEPQVQPNAQTQPVDAYIQMESLMNQLNGLARTFVSSEGTTLQMQLNPENLGKLVLTVTEKNGSMTAQLTATNEQVKEALQTQMAELHATLQSQGIKVEAVEVTVATHEFEQNLDGNSSANAQMQQQSEQQGAEEQRGGRRNLDSGSIETLAGQLTDEETLAAQIMRDNGGSIDYTA